MDHGGDLSKHQGLWMSRLGSFCQKEIGKALREPGAMVVWMLCAFMLAAWSGPAHANHAAGEHEVVIQLKWRHQFQFAGYYAAKEKGFYADEGLDVELRERQPNQGHIQQVLQGETQYGIADSGLIYERLKGEPVVLVAQIFQRSPMILITLKKSGLKTPTDLAGKRVMLDPKGRSDTPLIAMLMNALKRFDAFKPHSLNVSNWDLVAGRVDALNAYITDRPYWFAQRNIPIHIIDPYDHGINFYGDNLFTTESELENHPRRVAKMRRATLRGWRYAMEHPQEMIDIILKNYNSQGLNRDQLEYEAQETKKLILHELVPLGKAWMARLQQTADIFAKHGMTDSDWIDPIFLYQPTQTESDRPLLSLEELHWIIIGPLVLLLLVVAVLYLVKNAWSDAALKRHFGSPRFRSMALSVVVVMALFVAFLVAYTLAQNRELILNSRVEDLQEMQIHSMERSHDWINKQLEWLMQMGQNSELVALTRQLMTVPRDAETLRHHPFQEQIRAFFRRHHADFGDIGFFIITPDRISIGSMRNSNLGTINLIENSHPALLARAFQGEGVFVPPIPAPKVTSVAGVDLTSKREWMPPISLFFAVPVKDQEGQILAVLTRRMLPEKELSRMMHIGHHGKSGETYLINLKGRIVNRSRFEQQLIELGLVQPEKREGRILFTARDPGGNLIEGFKATLPREHQPLTHAAKGVLQLAQESLFPLSDRVPGTMVVEREPYRDYRGVPVIGAWRWDPLMKLGFISEMGLEEALQDYHALKINLLIIVGTILVLSMFTTALVVVLSERATQLVKQDRRELEKRVEERTRELRESQQAAEVANRAKSTFLATMSHEIRTPMNAIVGTVELLLRTPLTDKQQHHIQTIFIANKNLMALVGNILDFSKIEQGKMQLTMESFSPGELVDELQQLFATPCREKGLQLLTSVDERLPSQLKSDPDRIRQILINLISNAIKFTAEGEVVVSLHMIKQEGSRIHLSFGVRDSGIGIPEDQLNVLFQPFVQADSSTSRSFGGTGLGLAITRSLVDLLDGHIQVESTPGEGSLFQVLLRVIRVEESIPTDSEEREIRADNLSLLVVEDDPVSRSVMEALLTNEGYRVNVVDGGQEALKAVHETPYDAVLMDLRMPGMDGLEATRLIRQNSDPRIADTVVVALTADVAVDTMHQARSAGIDHVLTKPVDLKQINRLLASIA